MQSASSGQILPYTRTLAGKLVAITIFPVHVFSPYKFPTWQDRRSDFWWPRPHICVSYASHLHDRDNREVAIATLVEHIKTKLRRAPITFGIAFSFFHCVVVRVGSTDTPSVAHTDALQFLPSFYATEPSTPGLSALVRLGNLSASDDSLLFHSALESMWWAGPSLRLRTQETTSVSDLSSSSIPLLHLPLEVITEIASFLDQAQDLNCLAIVCKKTLHACVPRLRFPQLNNTDPLSHNEHGYIITSYLSSTASNATAMTRDTLLQLIGGVFAITHNGRQIRVKLSPVKAIQWPAEYVDLRDGCLVLSGKFFLPSVTFPPERLSSPERRTYRDLSSCMPKMQFW
ncbi:hypothetical protein BC835DRAFT_161848 [Cytidiella melzeri]|nr:hypothetical protein BC835DRAFT_161848 [Cytidiella melzeri]